MNEAQFRLGYRDDKGRLHAEYFPDLVMLRDRLEEFNLELHGLVQRWEDNLDEDWTHR